MATNLVQAIGNHITVTAPAALSSGDPVLIGSLFGVAQTDAASGASVVIATEGVWTLPKVASPDAFAIGDPVFFDPALGVATADITDSGPIGVAVSVGGSGAIIVNVKLNGVSLP